MPCLHAVVPLNVYGVTALRHAGVSEFIFGRFFYPEYIEGCGTFCKKVPKKTCEQAFGTTVLSVSKTPPACVRLS